MRIFTWLTASVIILTAVTSCSSSSLPDGKGLAARTRQVWEEDWHAVWEIEWAGAPVRGSLIAEIWHTADDRLRIETLEAPTAALSGLTLVDDGATTWLYDLRQNQVETGPDELVRIPLASNALDAIDWLLLNMDSASTVNVSGHGTLESGPATRLEIILSADDRAALWVHDETGLPARVELCSAVWGEATFTARSIDPSQDQYPGLIR
jgi:outer membrane lipoprotein-sorting protein